MSKVHHEKLKQGILLASAISIIDSIADCLVHDIEIDKEDLKNAISEFNKLRAEYYDSNSCKQV